MKIFVLVKGEGDIHDVLVYDSYRDEMGSIPEKLFEKYIKDERKVKELKRLSDYAQLLAIDEYCPQIFMIIDSTDTIPIYRRATESYERIVRL